MQGDNIERKYNTGLFNFNNTKSNILKFIYNCAHKSKQTGSLFLHILIDDFSWKHLKL